ncbi:MAG: zinc ribbon domain-containing protein [Anaerolineales bacterium]|nr:zinc ribbon domain-containing protein [Anaerolineales bacterium]MBP6208810.1 zinc ribbon domain-containing protein [Anaerolineales bacterium]
MPTYDFICNNCQKRFEVFMTFNEYGKKAVHCAHCQSDNVRRRMTKVRIAKSEETRMESMADDFSGMDGIEDDPKALARMMKKMGSEMGEEMPSEFNDVVDRLEAGQSPEEIESALPDMGLDDSGGE